MSCRTVRAWIPRHVEGELPPDATLSLARHVERCTSCRIVLARERRLGEILDGMEDSLDVDPSFLDAVMAALPDRGARSAAAPEPRERWRRGLKLAGLSSVALLGSAVLARLLPAVRFDLSGPALPRFVPESANGWLGILGSTVHWVRVTAESVGWSGGRTDLRELATALVLEMAVVAAAAFLVGSAALGFASRALPRLAGDANGASTASRRG